MLYRDMCGRETSLLGFGCMRLPVAGGPAEVDDARALEIADILYEGGVNYFDTAYSYHDGASESFVGRALRRYPRERVAVATKMPGHEIRPTFNPEAIFEEQLLRTGAGYFDYYLLHNVSEMSVKRYMDPDLDILGYLVRQKRAGRIRHLGFSCHGGLGTLKTFLEFADAKAPGEVEFIQLQLNYVDWLLQDGAAKYDVARDAGLDVVVMEGLRGGKLAQLDGERGEAIAHVMDTCGAKSQAEAAFRWLMGLLQVKVVLSGMSTREQAEDNLRIFAGEAAGGPAALVPGSEAFAALEAVARQFADMVPCTGCRYCTRECPMELDIPTFIKLYDDARFGASVTLGMRVEALPEEERPDACLGCGACAEVCPQGIAVPDIIAELNEMLAKIPRWADISAARVAAEEAARARR